MGYLEVCRDIVRQLEQEVLEIIRRIELEKRKELFHLEELTRCRDERVRLVELRSEKAKRLQAADDEYQKELDRYPKE